MGSNDELTLGVIDNSLGSLIRLITTSYIGLNLVISKMSLLSATYMTVNSFSPYSAL